MTLKQHHDQKPWGEQLGFRGYTAHEQSWNHMNTGKTLNETRATI